MIVFFVSEEESLNKIINYLVVQVEYFINIL